MCSILPHTHNSAPPPQPSSCSLLEESDYQTDYDEEAMESALSDMDVSTQLGEITEEETANTVRDKGVLCGLTGQGIVPVPGRSPFQILGLAEWFYLWVTERGP